MLHGQGNEKDEPIPRPVFYTIRANHRMKSQFRLGPAYGRFNNRLLSFCVLLLSFISPDSREAVDHLLPLPLPISSSSSFNCTTLTWYAYDL
jgi:hypothetical protein